MGGWLFLSALFSGSEAALFSLSRIQIRHLRQAHPKLEGSLQLLAERPRRILLTLLLGNTLAHVAFFSTASGLATRAGWEGFSLSLFSLAAVGAVLLLGEISPKAVALSHPERFSLWLIWPLAICIRLGAPLLRPLEVWLDRMGKAGRESSSRTEIPSEEMTHWIDRISAEGALSVEEGKMLKEVLSLRRLRVSEVMIPRVDLALFRVTDPRDRLLQLIQEHRLKRILVYDRSIDHVLGVVRAQDGYLYPEKPLRELIQTVPFVPEQARLESLLRLFQKERQTTAIVLDEYGGTAGLVTLEDLAEEIVGEILDEFEHPPLTIDPLGPRTYQVGGRLPVRELNDLLNLHLPLDRAETVGGLVVALLDRPPREGDEVRFEEGLFRVTRIKRKGIEAVQFHLPPSPETSP
jgi:CBS domain containing-hemolysin-like protein